MSKKIEEGSPWVNDDGDELKVNYVNKVDRVTYVHYTYLEDGRDDFAEDGVFLWLFKPKT